jgi:A118 family predicted phage portal protein
VPLPDNGAPWPPPAFAAEYGDMRLDDAWYAGDRRRLAELYARDPQRADGRRRLWGRRTPEPGRRDDRLHVPLPADIAHASAALLFSEPPVFTVEDTATQARLDELTEAGGVANTLLEAAEIAAALGGVFLRVTWDAQLAARPLLTSVHPDCAVPEVRFGHLVAVTFWRELSSDSATVWRHLERHERGAILHGLYQGDHDRLGVRVPLADHPAVAELADSLSDGDTITTGIDQLTAAYVPNIKPNRRRRGSPLGRSDFQGTHDLFDAIDTTWSSWLRDIRLARARLIVPAGYLTTNGPGRGATWDDDREVWQALNIPPTEAGGAGSITLSQFGIRVEEHRATAEAITRQAVESAGYSAATFGLGSESGPAVTATEVTARERRSMITRDVKARYWSPALADMLQAVLRLDRVLGFSRVAEERPRIQFGDAVSEDPRATAETLSLLAQAQAASIETRVRILHPEWDDPAVAEEVERIQVETGARVPDPMQAGALP